MVQQGSYGRAAGAVLIVAAIFTSFGAAGATNNPTVNENRNTLLVSVPGPFNGCTFLNAGATSSSDAVLDLVRPSAFLTSTYSNLYGAGWPIASAELTSLGPETVSYTIAAKQHWSNGQIFNGKDLVSWWRQARSLASVQSDGYRAIRSMKVSKDGLTVTAVFGTLYSNWNLLFRDVESLGVANRNSCALSNLVRRPSLGPYTVVKATRSRIVLAINKSWPLATSRFGRIIVSDSQRIPASDKTSFASYSLTVNRAQMQALSVHPSVLSHIGASSNIEELTFAPDRPLTRSFTIRQAISLSLNRQSMINQIWGAVTFSPSAAASALFSQGQSAYPGNNGTSPTQQSNGSSRTGYGSTSSLSDCLSCAFQSLKSAGYHRTKRGWLNSRGKVLALQVAVGPSVLDRATAALAIKRWGAAGIPVTSLAASSERAAASMAASNRADAALFTRPTMTTPSYSARSWSGPPYADTFPSGDRSAAITSLYRAAISDFNPVAANITWLQLDQKIMSGYRVRPLFTAPSLVEWSSTVTGVFGSLSVSGFLDQVTTWNSAVLSSGS